MNKRLLPRSSKTLLSLAITAALTCMTAPVVYAQDSSEESSGALEEILVTTSRREERIRDVPAAITAIDVDLFERSGLIDPKSLLDFVPAVQVDNDGTNYQNLVTMRGVVSTGSAGVGTYINNVPFGSSTGYSIGGSTVNGTLLDLDRIEVVKGPQGTLYGASSMSGLIKYVTQQPSMNETIGEVSTDLSSTQHGGFNQLYRAKVSTPLVDDQLALSFNGFYRDNDGFIDNVTIPAEGVDAYEYYGGTMNLLWKPSDRMTIDLMGMYQKSTQDGRAVIQVDGNGTPIVGRYQTAEVALAPSDYQSDLLALTISYDFDWATFSSTSGYQTVNFSQTQDITDGLGFLPDILDPANAPHSVQFQTAISMQRFTQEFQLTSAQGEKTEWIAGVFYSDEKGSNYQEFVVDPFVDLLNVTLPSTYKELAAFGNFTYKFTDNFDTTIGLRQSHYDATFEQQGGGFLATPLPERGADDDVTTYLFTTRYRVNDNTSWYGRIASGYRPGGANAVADDPITGEPFAPPIFKPDTLWNYELGVKGNTADQRLSYEAAIFYIDWKDYQIGIIRNGVGVLGNADKATSMGAEGALNFQVTDNFSMAATLAYVETELGVDEPDLGGAKGDPIPGSPKWSGSLSASYNFQVGGKDAYVDAFWRYRGDFPVSYDGVVVDGAFYPPSAPNLEIDAYNVFDISYGMSMGRFDWTLYVSNLLDEYAYESVQTNALAAGLATVVRPRTYGVSMRLSF